MAGKGEDSNTTTTDDNISLNEVNWLNLDTLLYRYLFFFFSKNEAFSIEKQKLSLQGNEKNRKSRKLAEIKRKK